MKQDGHSERVLVWTARPRDTQLTVRLLEKGNLVAERCNSVADLESGMEAGAGCAVIAEEVLTAAARESLVRRLEAQPPWSDFPFVLFSAERSGGVEGLGNVTRLDRPVRVATLLSAVRAALRARRRQYQAEEAIRRRDQFLAMLGHELRNPLAPIATAVKLMGLRGDERSKREREVIERQVAHLSRLVDDLLDVSRIAQGKIELSRRPVDIAEIAAKAVEMVSHLLENKSQELQIDVPRDELFVDGDAVRLAQVLGNLLTNAARYTPERGHVRLSAAREGEQIVVRVKDDGMGIAPEFLPHIFDLFVQGPRTIDRREGGLGLGLALVKNLVALHGGSVRAQSGGPGLGSEFAVRLPSLHFAQRPSPAPHGESRRPARARRVLVVDDNADAAETLAQALLTMGHEVEIAHDGPEGLAIQKRFQAEIGVLDLGLPLMDGYELAARMRQITSGPLRLIALTGYGQDRDRERTAEAGFDAHVVKPVELDELNELISELPAGGETRG
jgi:signal transduction histidine kinase/ActR/RegA family two-component response regulator